MDKTELYPRCHVTAVAIIEKIMNVGFFNFIAYY